MSNEILLGNLSANPVVGMEPPLVIEEKKERGRKGRLLFLIAIGLGTVSLASISLLLPVTFYGGVGNSGGIGDDSRSGGDSATLHSESLAPSAEAIDGGGTAIGDNDVTKSDEMTISGYSDSTYSTKLLCSVDSLPAYCSGSPVTFSGLPAGEHVFTVIGSGSDKTAVQSFSWNILE